MASRRTRLKGVINLPVRRSTVQSVPFSNSEPLKSVNVQADQTISVKLGKGADDVQKSFDDDILIERKDCTDSGKHVREPQETKQKVSSEVPVTEIIISDGDDNTSLKTESPPHSDLRIPLPVRKRVKPSVTLLALNRESKDRGDAEHEKACRSSSSHRPIFESADVDLEQNRLTKGLAQSPCTTDSSKSPSVLCSSVQSSTRSHKNRITSSPIKCVQIIFPKSKHEKPIANSIESVLQQDIIGEELDAGNQSVNQLIHNEADEVAEKDSLCSSSASEGNTTNITSVVQEDASETEDIHPAKIDRRPHTHRRPRRSGVGEILSIARRDFYKKFGNSTPDKKKLTMFDLIFYNPTTNPMKHANKPKLSDQNNTVETISDSVSERIAEESIDDVASIDDEVHSSIPAPQVKVGPDGSLVIDEKSLVIATTGSQKRKDELASSSVVVDYGLGNTTYNSFSKKVKSREWTKEETFKFYRALQAVGTDFLLMKSIFPNRTRGDLKQKYKKEDRLNRNLVDKILQNPLEFDLTVLEQELAQEEKENERKEQKKKSKVKRIKGKGAVGNALLGEFSHPDNKIHSTQTKHENNAGSKNTQQMISKKRKVVSDGSSTEDEECEIQLESDFDSGKTIGEEQDQNISVKLNDSPDSDEETESNYLLKSPLPTRYGRLPRSSVLSKEATSTIHQQTSYITDDTENVDDCEIILEGDTNLCVDAEREQLSVSNSVAKPTFSESNLSNVEPGSLVILSTPGQETLQLFMVAPKSQNSTLTHIPVAVTPEILASVNSSINGLGSREASASTDAPVSDSLT